VRWVVFVLACAVSWLLYLHRYSWGVIKPALRAEYPDLTDKQLGWLDSVFQVTYAFGQVPGGLAGDVWGPRMVLSLGILLWSGTLAALAWTTGVFGMAGVRAAFGLAQAGAYPNLSKVTRSWFPLSIRTTVQGAVASLSGRAGGACASIVIATLLMGQLGLGWRGALITISAAGILLAAAFWLLFRNSPADHPWANAAEAAAIDLGNAPVVVGERPRISWNAANVFTLSAMMTYAFASTFVDQLFVNWVPLLLVERGLDSAQMGMYASLPLLGGALGGAFGGLLNDGLIRLTGSRRWGRSSVAFTGKMIGGILLALSILEADGRVVALTLMAAKFFGDWSMTTLWGTVTDIGGRAAGTVFAVVNTAGAVAGFVANPWIGHMKQDYGWETTFFGLAGVFFAAAIAWLFIDSNRRLLADGQNT